MKIAFLIVCANLSLYTLAQTNDEKAIRTMLDDQTRAWNAGDIEGFMKGYWESDSLMFIGKNGVTYGWTNTLDNYKKGYPDTSAMGKLVFTLLSLKQLSTIYFSVAGKWQLFRTSSNLSGHFTLLLKKINGNWVIVSDHSS